MSNVTNEQVKCAGFYYDGGIKNEICNRSKR